LFPRPELVLLPKSGRSCVDLVMVRALVLLVLLLAACGGRAHSRAPTGDAPQNGIAIELTADARSKLSPLFAQYVDRRLFSPNSYVAVIVIGHAVVGDREQAELDRIGGKYVWHVTTKAREGALDARPADGPADTIVVHLLSNNLASLIEMPWVKRIEIASGYPSGPRLPEEARRRIGPHLMSELSKLGADRLQRVVGYGQASGCLDEARQIELRARGASISGITADQACSSSSFTFLIETDKVPAIASLPWIVRLEREPEFHIN
jgi:hypothetical protein